MAPPFLVQQGTGLQNFVAIRHFCDCCSMQSRQHMITRTQAIMGAYINTCSLDQPLLGTDTPCKSTGHCQRKTVKTQRWTKRAVRQEGRQSGVLTEGLLCAHDSKTLCSCCPIDGKEEKIGWAAPAKKTTRTEERFPNRWLTCCWGACEHCSVLGALRRKNKRNRGTD
eukprot:1158903-Pelagomonas_calceolata.AAC.9